LWGGVFGVGDGGGGVGEGDRVGVGGFGRGGGRDDSIKNKISLLDANQTGGVVADDFEAALLGGKTKGIAGFKVGDLAATADEPEKVRVLKDVGGFGIEEVATGGKATDLGVLGGLEDEGFEGVAVGEVGDGAATEEIEDFGDRSLLIELLGEVGVLIEEGEKGFRGEGEGNGFGGCDRGFAGNPPQQAHPAHHIPGFEALEGEGEFGGGIIANQPHLAVVENDNVMGDFVPH
jgi:hypothetical protein